MPDNILHHPPIQRALGIQTGDIITTSYNTGPHIIHHIHGPFTYFTGVGHLVILDHPEISLNLSTPNAKRKAAGGFINNIRQVNERWYTPKTPSFSLQGLNSFPSRRPPFSIYATLPTKSRYYPHHRFINLTHLLITTQGLAAPGIATIAMSTSTPYRQIDIGASTIAKTNPSLRRSSTSAPHNPTIAALTFRITS